MCGWLSMGAVGPLVPIIGSEADIGVDQSESSKALALCAPYTHERRDTPARVDAQRNAYCGASSTRSAATIGRTVQGHRLPNGLCAPLRC
jgi:hypothetical protein